MWRCYSLRVTFGRQAIRCIVLICTYQRPGTLEAVLCRNLTFWYGYTLSLISEMGTTHGIRIRIVDLVDVGISMSTSVNDHNRYLALAQT